MDYELYPLYQLLDSLFYYRIELLLFHLPLPNCPNGVTFPHARNFWLQIISLHIHLPLRWFACCFSRNYINETNGG